MVLGIDFTSRPRREKPIRCLSCALDDGVLRADYLILDRTGRREATCCHQNQSLYFRALAGAKSALAPGEHRVGWQPAIRNKQSSPHQMRLCMRPSVPKRVIIRGPSCRTFSGQQFWQLRNIPPQSAAPHRASNLTAETDAASRTLYRCRLQFLYEHPDGLFRFCPQGIKRAIERHNESKALLRIILPFEGHNRPFFENITI
jgi:hypothetical protein